MGLGEGADIVLKVGGGFDGVNARKLAGYGLFFHAYVAFGRVGPPGIGA